MLQLICFWFKKTECKIFLCSQAYTNKLTKYTVGGIFLLANTTGKKKITQYNLSNSFN